MITKILIIKDKEKPLKTEEKQHIVYKKTLIQMTTDFSFETMEARRK